LGLAPQRVTNPGNHPGNPHQKLLGGTKRMKKFLVLFVSAALVLSMAAVSLAAVTVNGDFRYNMYDDESKGSADNTYSETDLRVRVTGDLSDTVKATANVKFKRGTAESYNDYCSDKINNEYKNAENINTSLDEFYATAKYDWGTAKMGYYEYKFTPSRVELKSGGYHVWQKADALFEVNLPLAAVEGLTADLLCQPYKNDFADDGAYGVALNYKAENWGVKVSYADFKNDDYGDLTAIDAYYMIDENKKVFVDAVDFSENDGSGKYDDGLDPVIGFAWSNIADMPLYASLEYATTPRNKDKSNEYDEYIAKVTYKLSNNIGLEFYHYVVGDSQNKEMFRIRYKF
jgi:hypothetical protein